MADAQGEKTEKPSAKKLKDARDRGQVARSRELSSAAGSLAATGALAVAGGAMVHRLSLTIADTLGGLDRTTRLDVGSGELMQLVTSNGLLLTVIAAPVALAALAGGVSAAVAQGGIAFSKDALQMRWERLSPANGLKKLAPSQSWLDTLRTILAATILSVLAWKIGRELALDLPRLAWTPTAVSASRGWDLLLRLLWQSGFALLALGAADYGLQYWRLWSSLKMSRQEVRDEAKSNEGSPEIKARVRRVQRDMARRRLLHATAHATVVITNPTHFAVALEYRRDKSPAPIVVAKGQDLVAGRMREIARVNEVPIIENPPLARALFKGVEVGDMIPAPLFGAVAEVLAYLVRIRRLVF